MTWLVMALLAASPFERALEKRCPVSSDAACTCAATLGDKPLKAPVLVRAERWLNAGCGLIPKETEPLGACEEYRTILVQAHEAMEKAPNREERSTRALYVGIAQGNLMGCIVGELSKKPGK
jgi:hypothetical protein